MLVLGFLVLLCYLRIGDLVNSVGVHCICIVMFNYFAGLAGGFGVLSLLLSELFGVCLLHVS